MIKGLESLFRRFTGQEPAADKPAAPAELSLDELGLRLANDGPDWVAVTSRWGDRRLFKLRGQLQGNPRKAVEYSIPIQTSLPGGTIPGRTYLTLAHAPSSVPSQAAPELVRSSHNPLPPDGQILEFLFVHDQDEIRLTFRLSDQVEVGDFERVADTRPLFRTLPPVSQMAAVLGAVARGRRAALNLLEELAPQAHRDGTRAALAELKELYPPQADLADATVRQLHTLLAGAGNPHPLSELAAMTLFVELEQGALTLEEIRTAAGEGQPPTVAPASAFLVSRALLAEIDPSAWDEAFPSSSYDSCLELTRKPAWLGITRTLRSPRAPRHLDLLNEVARQTSSRRVEAFVAECQGTGEFLVHRDQAELHQLLVGAGCRADPAAVAALSAFVDVEAGLLTDESPYVPSLYALMAVAGAYGTPLRALSRPSTDTEWLAPLSDLCHGALLGQFLDEHGARQLRSLPTPEDVATVQDEGLSFTGRVLARLPLAERLGEADLRLLEKLATPFAALRAEQWQVGGEGRFEGSVLAVHRTAVPEAYPVVAVDRDDRSELTLRFVRSEGELRAASEGCTWAGVTLELPPLGALGLPWTELSQEQLLGRTGTLAKEAQTLSRLYPALQQVLSRQLEYRPLPPELWKEALRQLGSGYFKSLLAEAIPATVQLDVKAQEALEILAPLEVLGRVDGAYLTLELLGPLLRAQGQENTAYHRLRRDRLDELLRHRDPAVRRAAVQMLVSAGLPEDRLHPLPLQFELSRTCADADASVAEEAYQALARFSLGGAVPFPVAARRPLEAEEAEPEDNLGRQLDELWPRLGELAPTARRESIGRAAAEVERLGRRAPLVELLSGMNRAFREDRDKSVVLLCLLSQAELLNRRLGSLQKWKFFAYSQQVSLATLLTRHEPDQLWADYLNFQKESESVVKDSPTRLGSGQPVQVYRVRRPVGPWEREGELSQFFLDLVEMAAKLPPEQIRVCRVRANLPPIESFFFWDVAIDPRLVDVYEPRARRFTPQMHHLSLTPAQVGYEDQEWEDFEALVSLFTESRPTFRLLPKLSREVAAAFDLPSHYSKQILKMLVEIGAEAVYEF